MFFMQPHERLFRRSRVAVTNGLVDIQSGKPFTIMDGTFGPGPVRFHKRQILGTLIPFAADSAKVVAAQQTEESGESGKLQGHKYTVDDLELSHLEPTMASHVKAMLRKHQEMWSGRLGEIKAPPHRTELVQGSKPVHAHPYRAGPHPRQVESERLQQMKDDVVIEEARSEWASPGVLVSKPDGSLRFCVDYRRVNAITVKDTYPIPRMDECLDSLGDANYFTTLDCNRGYWQIPIAEEDKDKATFTCHPEHFDLFGCHFGFVIPQQSSRGQ